MTEDFAARLPKAELHCHLAGTLRLDTLAELAEREGITVENDFYSIASPEEFFRKLDVAAAVLTTPADLERAAYECLVDSARDSNVRYCELSVNPTAHPVPYVELMDALCAGGRRAESDAGIRWRIIPAVLRQQGVERAHALVDDILADGRSEVVGVGLDGDESVAPPEWFGEVFARVAAAGLHRTVHITMPPPERVRRCIEELGFERIDHGYYAADDDDELCRHAASGIPTTVCFTMTCHSRGWTSDDHPIRRQWEAGLRLVIGTDDRAFVGTTLAREYRAVADMLSLNDRQLAALAIASAEAVWLPDAERQRLVAEFDAEIARLLDRRTAGAAR